MSPEIGSLSASQAAAASIRVHDELARGSRAGTATAGGRNMQPMAMAESRVEYGSTFAWTAGAVVADTREGYGYGGYDEEFAYV
jgi:hypothetical protein